MKSQKQFFWASFLPAIAYWYLEANYTLQIALIGGLILAVLEMFLEWILTRHIHTLSKFNFFLILVLGGIALIAHEGIWFKLQPFFTGLLMGGYLLFRNLKGKSLMIEMMTELNPNLPKNPFIEVIERNMSFFLIGYGIFMAIVALQFATDEWLFYKTIGFYIATLIFFVIQMIYIKVKVRRTK